MERHICVRFLWCLVIILVTVQLVHTECAPGRTPATQVAQMCTHSTVNGTVLYVDTSGASATVNETGTLCVCKVNAPASSGKDLSVTIEGHIASCGARIVLANTTNNFTTAADNCMLTNHTVMVPTDDVITMGVEKLKEPYDAQFCAKYEIVGSSEEIRIECFKSDRLAETATTLLATETTSQTTIATTVTSSATASQITSYAASTLPTNTSSTTSITSPISMITLTTDTTATLSATAQPTSTTPTNTTQTTSNTPSMATSTTDTPTAPSASTISVVTSSSSTKNQTLSSTTIIEERPGDGTSGKAATFTISCISVLVILISLAVAV